MDQYTLVIFLLLVFGTVLLLSQIIIIPTFGSSAQESRRLQKRLLEIDSYNREASVVSLVREEQLRHMGAFERWLDALPWTPPLQRLLDQTGRRTPAYRLVLLMGGLALAAAGAAWFFTRNPWIALGVGVMAGFVPLLKLRRERGKRLAKFEEQLPDALDLMVRALRAGTPFNAAMSFVSLEMGGPVAEEFGLTFDEINYGRDVSQAFNLLILRVPSLSLMAMTTSISIQRETGGNLAEVLEKISLLLRGRFRFQRQVRTLTAEGRLSAWILGLIPLFLFMAMASMQPEVYEKFFHTDLGVFLTKLGVGLMVVGMIWIARLIDIEV